MSINSEISTLIESWLWYPVPHCDASNPGRRILQYICHHLLDTCVTVSEQSSGFSEQWMLSNSVLSLSTAWFTGQSAWLFPFLFLSFPIAVILLNLSSAQILNPASHLLSWLPHLRGLQTLVSLSTPTPPASLSSWESERSLWRKRGHVTYSLA